MSFTHYNETNLVSIDHNKEEKLAAAKNKLKQFKKESSKQNKTDHFISNNNSTNNHHHYNQENKTDNSGRSSPASTHSSLNSNSFNNKTSGSSTFINSQSTNAPLDYKDQQLQLHVQTIGILVAEKAELHSKLQQTLKKCDKKQEECDELSGRLKVSRQKITDLERLVQQLNQSITSEASISSDQQATNSVEDSNQTLIVDELRMKLNETNDKLVYKQQDLNQMNQLNSELASQLEILTIKLTQFTNSDPETIRAELDESEKRAAGLLAKNQTLQATINDYEFKLKQQHDQLKQEYQQYVDQLKHQIEGLVDQINRLTDEREASFSKIDSLEDMLNKLRKKNESLEANLTEQAAKLKENDQATNSKQTNKEQLLENEIKYFKQQIEILVSEHNNLIGLLDEKERLIGSLERQIQTHEQNKEQHAKLLEQTHNDRQTLSRAIQQNKELKDQLAELQDAFVSVTKQNLDLATQMESFKFSQIKVNNLVPQGEELNVKLAETTEWDDDSDGFRSAEAVESAPSQDNALQQVSLMSGIKDRLNELEKENKDLNDYITLMDENIKKNNDQQFSTINAQLKQIELMNQTIAEINVEKSDLKKQLEVLLLKKTDNNNNQNQNSDSKSGLTKTLEFNEANFKNLLLLENKFNKVMNENADLKEKNQELDHVVSQLQFETETIVDYITMYQMEREKLNKKYELKDETIRSLCTQLQINKLALQELNNYFGAYIRIGDSSSEEDSKKMFILIQAQSLLNELTSRSSSSLQNSMNNFSSSNRLNPNNNNNNNSNNINMVNKLKQNLAHTSNHHNEHHEKQEQHANDIDPVSVQAFRSKVSVCPSCQGDLFVV